MHDIFPEKTMVHTSLFYLYHLHFLILYSPKMHPLILRVSQLHINSLYSQHILLWRLESYIKKLQKWINGLHFHHILLEPISSFVSDCLLELFYQINPFSIHQINKSNSFLKQLWRS